MVALGPDAPAPAENARVESARGAHGEALHAGRERDAVVGLDEHVHVVTLHRVLDDAKVVATRSPHRLAQLVVEQLTAQARKTLRAPQRDMHRPIPSMLGPHPMAHVRARRGLSTGTRPRPSPRRHVGQRELLRRPYLGRAVCTPQPLSNVRDLRHVDWGRH